MRPLIGTDGGVKNWCAAARNIFYHCNTTNLVMSTEMLNFIAQDVPQEAFVNWCGIITNAVFLEQNRRLLGASEAFQTTFCRMVIQNVKDAECCIQCCCALIRLVRVDDVNQSSFVTESLRSAFVHAASFATTNNACGWWCVAILSLCCAKQDDRGFLDLSTLGTTDSTRKNIALLSVKSLIDKHAAMKERALSDDDWALQSKSDDWDSKVFWEGAGKAIGVIKHEAVRRQREETSSDVDNDNGESDKEVDGGKSGNDDSDETSDEDNGSSSSESSDDDSDE